MKKKIKKNVTKETVAQELTRLSGIIAEGEFIIGESTLTLGETVSFSYETKVKNNFIAIDISLRIPLNKEESGEMPFSSVTPQKKPKKEIGYSGKKIKKTIAALWKLVKKSVEQGQQPPKKDVDDLLDNLASYTPYTEPAWESQWKECQDAVAKVMALVQNNHFEEANALIKDIDQMTRECHKKFK